MIVGKMALVRMTANKMTLINRNDCGQKHAADYPE